ncbi:hypothetical protein Taro_029593 [Colocasia esculenta]|uniref:Pentatricopeptide repeat-containing protein n=1 Tax=Colocasia esculenta TaxID=4460 RepID=A0A843VLT1_COLES|nr:hypothetical protein [Colocasia esculenta]
MRKRRPRSARLNEPLKSVGGKCGGQIWSPRPMMALSCPVNKRGTIARGHVLTRVVTYLIVPNSYRQFRTPADATDQRLFANTFDPSHGGVPVKCASGSPVAAAPGTGSEARCPRRGNLSSAEMSRRTRLMKQQLSAATSSRRGAARDGGDACLGAACASAIAGGRRRRGRVSPAGLGLCALGEMLKRGRRYRVPFFNDLIDELCKEKRVVDARQLLEEMPRMGLAPNDFSFGLLLKGLCRTGDICAALELLRKMATKGGCCVPPNVVSYSAVINGFCKMGNTSGALDMLREMAAQGCEPNVVTYNTLIDALCRRGSVSQALKLMNEMKVVGISPDVITYNTLVNCLCKKDCTSIALQLVREMMGEESCCKPNIATYNTITNSLCENGFIKDALQLIGEVKAAGIDPDTISYDTIIKGLCRTGKTRLAIQLLKSGSCFKPSLISYNTIFDGLCDEGSLDDALTLMKEMKDKGISPDIITYNTLVKGICRRGNASMALNVLKEMAAKGSSCKPNKVTYCTILDCLFKEGYMDDGLKLMEGMNDAGIPSDLIMYNTLIDGLCRKGDTNLALEVLKKMRVKKNCCKPDVVTYSIIINRLCEEGSLDGALRLIGEMDACCIWPDVVMYTSMIKGLCRRGNSSMALELLKKMEMQDSCKPDVVTYNTVIEGLCEEGHVDDALRLFQDMNAGGIASNAVTYNILVKYLCRMGNTAIAVGLAMQCDYHTFDITLDALIDKLRKQGSTDDGLEPFMEVNAECISSK